MSLDVQLCVYRLTLLIKWSVFGFSSDISGFGHICCVVLLFLCLKKVGKHCGHCNLSMKNKHMNKLDVFTCVGGAGLRPNP